MATHATTEPELPTLDGGVYRLRTDGRATGPLQALVVDHLLFHDGPAYWVDAAGRAQTGSLARLAPGRRVLDRVRVARAFTAFQHYGLVDALISTVSDDAGLVVLPALDAPYHEDDLARGEPGRLLAGVADRVAGLAADRDAPVLLTCGRDDELTRPVADAVDHEIVCESTRFGPRFVGDGFETLVYRDVRGVQTTLAFWRRVLRARRDAATVSGAAGTGGAGADAARSPDAAVGATVEGTMDATDAMAMTDATGAMDATDAADDDGAVVAEVIVGGAD